MSVSAKGARWNKFYNFDAGRLVMLNAEHTERTSQNVKFYSARALRVCNKITMPISTVFSPSAFVEATRQRQAVTRPAKNVKLFWAASLNPA